MKANRERMIFGGVLTAIFGTVLFLALGPSLWAQQPKDLTPPIPKPAVNTPIDPKYAEMFQEIMDFVANNYVDPVDQQKLFEGAMKGLFESLNDPYTLYLSESDKRDLSQVTTGEYGGVGLYIDKINPSQLTADSPPKNYFVEVTAPIEETPAWKAGILAGDYITEVDGKTTRSMTLDDVLKAIQGKPNTDVKLTILRGEKVTFTVTLTRAKIRVPTVRSALIGKTGYLRISQFSLFTPEDVKKALTDFQNQGYTSLIIDLRGNPGGLLDQVSKIGGFFFQDGVIVSTRSRISYENKVYKATGDQIVPDNLPIVVLTDHYSASASEILAGALKDRKRALLMGETTYGKGSVQNVIPYGHTGFKMTIARYYTPSGVNIDKVGIKPDKEVKQPEMTEKDLEGYKKLTQDGIIADFLKSKADTPTEDDTNAFLKKVHGQGISLDDRVVRKLLRVEEAKAKNVAPPVYDLDYDQVLSEALKLLKSGAVKAPVQ